MNLTQQQAPPQESSAVHLWDFAGDANSHNNAQASGAQQNEQSNQDGGVMICLIC